MTESLLNSLADYYEILLNNKDVVVYTYIVVYLAFYVLSAIGIMLIGKKMGAGYIATAWVPIVRIFSFFGLSKYAEGKGKPYTWMGIICSIFSIYLYYILFSGGFFIGNNSTLIIVGTVICVVLGALNFIRIYRGFNKGVVAGVLSAVIPFYGWIMLIMLSREGVIFNGRKEVENKRDNAGGVNKIVSPNNQQRVVQPNQQRRGQATPNMGNSQGGMNQGQVIRPPQQGMEGRMQVNQNNGLPRSKMATYNPVQHQMENNKPAPQNKNKGTGVEW